MSEESEGSPMQDMAQEEEEEEEDEQEVQNLPDIPTSSPPDESDAIRKPEQGQEEEEDEDKSEEEEDEDKDEIEEEEDEDEEVDIMTFTPPPESPSKRPFQDVFDAESTQGNQKKLKTKVPREEAEQLDIHCQNTATSLNESHAEEQTIAEHRQEQEAQNLQEFPQQQQREEEDTTTSRLDAREQEQGQEEKKEEEVNTISVPSPLTIKMKKKNNEWTIL